MSRTPRRRSPLALLPILPLLILALAATCDGNSSDKASDPTGAVPVYVAVGDSLSAGVGASDVASTGFVPLVHESLGESYVLANLGHSGDTSSQLLEHGHLNDLTTAAGTSGHRVRVITLEIGGNDLLGIYFSLVLPGVCPTLAEAREKPECVEALQDALAAFEPNLIAALDEVEAAAPDAQILLLTLYDPFSGELPVQSEIAVLAMEGEAGSQIPEGLNTIIRRQAERDNVTLVDIYPLFNGRGGELISGDFIHPNDAGYAVMADAVIAALQTLP